MNKIYIPSPGPNAWRAFLGDPDKHWRDGYSAKTMARCWEAARGLPPEKAKAMRPAIGSAELLLAIPEHKVALPGGGAASQCDVFALVRGVGGMVAMSVEGKVDETFDKTLETWRPDSSPGKRERLDFICDTLGIKRDPDSGLYYQLFHRTAAAVLEAKRFGAAAAAMVVHSFSPTTCWFDEFANFVAQFDVLSGDMEN